MENVSVSDTFLNEVLQHLVEYQEELEEAYERATIQQDEERIEARMDANRVLINRTKGWLGMPIPLETEQRCDECGSDVDEFMLCPDAAEICKACFDARGTLKLADGLRC